MHETRRPLFAVLAALLGGCPSDPVITPADAGPGIDGALSEGDAASDAAASDAPTADAFGVPSFRARCVYTNTFTERPECRDYRGPGWGAESAASDCERVFLGRPGTLEIDEVCAFDDAIGRCTVGDVDAGGYSVLSSGPPSSCGQAQAACETFARGTWTPDERCAGCEASGEVEANVFVPPYVDCRDARAGEPAGRTDGRVCTPTLISGSTEEGRQYADYADCDVVRTQRPYYAFDLETPLDPSDPRLLDEPYMDEVAWMREQAEASACACCHQSSRTPSGAAIWDTEAGPLWIDTISDEALAMLGGFTSSAEFGFYRPAESNGFDRSTTGLPTTDVARLRSFVALELARRGVTEDEARALPPFAPFFRELVEYVPSPCGPEVGLQPDGTLAWTGGPALRQRARGRVCLARCAAELRSPRRHDLGDHGPADGARARVRHGVWRAARRRDPAGAQRRGRTSSPRLRTHVLPPRAARRGASDHALHLRRAVIAALHRGEGD